MSSAAPLASPIDLAPATSTAPARLLVWASFAVIYLVWGSTFLGIRVAVETLPPLSMAAFRFLLAGGVLLAASSRVTPRPTAREWGGAAITGALFFLGNHGLVTHAARYLPSSLVCLIIATEVAFIALLSRLLLGQPLTRRGLFGASLGIVGVVALFAGQGVQGSWAMALPCAAVLGASLSWSLGAVLSKRVALPANAILRAAMQMSCGGAMLLAASVLRGEPGSIQLAAFSARSLWALAYLISFGSVLAFACYSFLLKHVRTDAVATHVFVNPLVAVAVGAWLGGERLQAAHLFSGLFILASVLLITVGQSPAAPRSVRR